VWDGLRAVLVVPSPKSQSQAVAPPGTSDVSVKLTVRGAVELVNGTAVKLATPV
jgi:hypothetical protein